MSQIKKIETICRKIELFDILQKNKFVINTEIYSKVNKYICEKQNATIVNILEIKRKILNCMKTMRNSWYSTKRSGRKIKLYRERISKEFVIFDVEM